ncbi:MAG: SDR family NAD(P)-dependent oxidoreductase [Dehalococcoidia bacterium]
MQLKEKIAIVTGGATGIGRAIALKLAEQGASVVVADVNPDAASETSNELARLGVGTAVALTDVTDRSATDEMAGVALKRFGRIDILVNNAGVAGAPGWHKQSKSRPEDWQFAYRVNVLGTVNATNSVISTMKQAREGKIVNLSSIAGREGRPSLPHYSASKAAVINYTQSLANDLARFNINVNAICPGLLWTPMWEQVGSRYAEDDPQYSGLTAREVYDRMVAARIPMGRGQTPEDIGEATVFLVSDDARNITGQALNVDGGFFMR